MKKRIKLTSTALVALGLVATAAPAFAADSTAGAQNTTGSGNATSWNSNTGVEFKAPTTITTPPDVTIPGGPTIPTNPANVAIDWASDYDFGINDIGGNTGTQTDFTAFDSTSSDQTKISPNNLAKPTVAFHDLQGTGTADYKIQANISKDLGLTGATLTLNGAGTFKNLEDTSASSSITGLVSVSDVTLTSNAQDIVTGIGVTPGYFSDQFTGATLSVPLSSQKAGSYTGQITWSLVDAR